MTARDRTPTVHAPGVLRIPLTRGLFALIDETDAPLVAPHLWCAWKRQRNSAYAVRKIGGAILWMHRAILRAPDGVEVDHIDGDGLNNRRSNLRLASRAENARNARLRTDNRSGFRGVFWHSRAQAWCARAKASGRVKQLGLFNNPRDAAAAYDRFVVVAHGPFASTNFDHGTTTS